MAEDDPQMSYMISAWARICKILGPGFAPYLPMVMGPVMKTASMKPEVALLDNEELTGVEDNDEDWQFVQLGEQQNFGIKTAGLEDKATACQMLVCYARELKEHFADYTEQVVKLMVPMLKFYFHDGVRTAAAESMPFLLECAKIKGPQYLQEMWGLSSQSFSNPLRPSLSMRSWQSCWQVWQDVLSCLEMDALEKKEWRPLSRSLIRPWKNIIKDRKRDKENVKEEKKNMMKVLRNNLKTRMKRTCTSSPKLAMSSTLSSLNTKKTFWLNLKSCFLNSQCFWC